MDARLPLDLAVPPATHSDGISFLDVEAVGSADAWAVGTSGRNILPDARPQMRHWHNGRWEAVRLPSWMNGAKAGGWINELQAVGGDAPGNVWAAGMLAGSTSSSDRAVHWNGRKWARAGKLPSAAAFAPLMTSILSFGHSNVWAFGCYCEASQGPYIARWRNGSWHDVTPKKAPYGGIFTASAISPRNIWAIATRSSSRSFALLHWNGVRWRITSAPTSLDLTAAQFTPGGGIVATRHGGVWLAGYRGAFAPFTPVIVHYAAGVWHVTKIAAPAGMQTLVPDGRGGLWSSSQAAGTTSSQIWHMSAGRWRRVAQPAGVSGAYAITWMAHVPGRAVTLAFGGDQKSELLLSTP